MYFIVASSQIQPIFVLNYTSTSPSPHTNFADVLSYTWTDPQTELQTHLHFFNVLFDRNEIRKDCRFLFIR